MKCILYLLRFVIIHILLIILVRLILPTQDVLYEIIEVTVQKLIPYMRHVLLSVISNGFISQWGNYTGKANAVTITLLTAFSSTSYYAHSNLSNKAIHTSYGWGTISSRMQTSFITAGGGNTSDQITWIAMGY